MTSKNVIVPRGMTPEMLDAAFNAMDKMYSSDPMDDRIQCINALWKSTISAAPQLSEAEMVEKVARAIFYQKTWLSKYDDYDDEKFDVETCQCRREAKAALRALGLIGEENARHQ